MKKTMTKKMATAKKVAEVAKHSKRDRSREEDIRLSFHNGMLAGLEAAKNETKDARCSKVIDRIKNRVIAHRDNRTHRSSRWYTGSCRMATVRGERIRAAKSVK